MFHCRTRKLSAALALMLASAAASAGSISNTFVVSATVVVACDTVSATPLNFGTFVNLGVDAASTVTVICTSGTAYRVNMDAGTGAGATHASRKLTSAGNTIDYSIFTDAARSNVWDNIGPVAIGTGSAQVLDVYGRIFPVATPPPGTYTDTITVTVKF